MRVPGSGFRVRGSESAAPGTPDRGRESQPGTRNPELETRGEEATRHLGATIGAVARAGDVILLQGPFGAGKTTLVQGIARGLGVQGQVTSPSFVIANEYGGRIPLYHVDLYRVEEMDPTTLEALAEYFDGPGLCVVEWPDSLPSDLTEGAARITLEVTSDVTRRLTLEAGPPHVADAFRQWARARTGPGVSVEGGAP